MTQQHPITPPPELVEQWRNLPEYVSQLRTMSTVTITTERLQHIATQAARWGADQQLELDARWLDHNALNETHLKITPIGDVLKEAMRPKPPSLKEQAMQALCRFMASEGHEDCTEEEVADDFTTIRRALEQLPDYE